MSDQAGPVEPTRIGTRVEITAGRLAGEDGRVDRVERLPAGLVYRVKPAEGPGTWLYRDEFEPIPDADAETPPFAGGA